MTIPNHDSSPTAPSPLPFDVRDTAFAYPRVKLPGSYPPDSGSTSATESGRVSAALNRLDEESRGNIPFLKGYTIPSPLLYHHESREALGSIDDDEFDLAKSFTIACGQEPPSPDFQSYKAHPYATLINSDECYVDNRSSPLQKHELVGAALPKMSYVEPIFLEEASKEDDVKNEADTSFYQQTRTYLTRMSNSRFDLSSSTKHANLCNEPASPLETHASTMTTTKTPSPTAGAAPSPKGPLTDLSSGKAERPLPVSLHCDASSVSGREDNPRFATNDSLWKRSLEATNVETHQMRNADLTFPPHGPTLLCKAQCAQASKDRNITITGGLWDHFSPLSNDQQRPLAKSLEKTRFSRLPVPSNHDTVDYGKSMDQGTYMIRRGASALWASDQRSTIPTLLTNTSTVIASEEVMAGDPYLWITPSALSHAIPFGNPSLPSPTDGNLLSHSTQNVRRKVVNIMACPTSGCTAIVPARLYKHQLHSWPVRYGPMDSKETSPVSVGAFRDDLEDDEKVKNVLEWMTHDMGFDEAHDQYCEYAREAGNNAEVAVDDAKMIVDEGMYCGAVDKNSCKTWWTGVVRPGGHDAGRAVALPSRSAEDEAIALPLPESDEDSGYWSGSGSELAHDMVLVNDGDDAEDSYDWEDDLWW